MTIDQFIPTAIFLTLVGLVYAFAVRAVFVRATTKRFPSAPVYPAAIVLGIIGLGCFAYGYFIEPYWPEVTHIQIRSSKLQGVSRPIRIVQLSDVHSDPTPRLEA